MAVNIEIMIFCDKKGGNMLLLNTDQIGHHSPEDNINNCILLPGTKPWSTSQFDLAIR